MAVTGLVYGEIYLKHYTGVKHPEQPERLLAILESLESAKLLDRLFRIEPVPVERSILELCHDPGYIDEFKLAADNARLFFHTHDCPLSPRTFEAALCAVGGVLKGADMVMEGKVENCFCAVRPPGHHAGRSRAMGFCYFNHIAIAAKYLQAHHSLERIAVIDWDVHHGNGTQDILEEDHTVYYASFHQDPSTCFPFTGKASETGKGKGEGYTRNFPVPPGAVGRWGMSLLQDFLWGSIANKLMGRLTHVPLCVVGGTPQIGKILVATDASEGAMRAVDYVGTMVNSADWEITLFHAVRVLDREELHKAEKSMESVFEKASSHLEKAGVNRNRITTRMVTGVPSRAGAIIEEALKGGYGTIVVGRRGLSDVEEFIMGRVSNKVIHMAQEKAVWVVT